MISAANASIPSQMMGARGMLSCCFGGGRTSAQVEEEGHDPGDCKELPDIEQDSEDKPAARRKKNPDEDSEDSDEEVKQNFDFAKNSGETEKAELLKHSIIAGGEIQSEITELVATETPAAGDAVLPLDLGEQTAILQVRFSMDTTKSKLSVQVVQVFDVTTSSSSAATDAPASAQIHLYQVHVMLLPSRRQKFKSKIRSGPDPKFDESFQFTKISTEPSSDASLRFRVYTSDRGRPDKVAGVCMVSLNSIDYSDEVEYNLSLLKNIPGDDNSQMTESVSHVSTDATSMKSAGSGRMTVCPEIMIGLAHNSNTGRLAVEVIKGAGLCVRGLNRPPDTYTKVTLISTGAQELAHSKTSIRRGQQNPTFRETFMFQVPLFQLGEMTVMITVYHKKTMNKKQIVGWFSLGSSSSGDEERNHWQQMRDSKGEQVCHWHVLLQSST